MSAQLNWQLRNHLHDLRDDGRLAVLTALILHANIRLRCWPSIDLLETESGWSRASVVAAKMWLAEHGAFVLVNYAKRVDEELDLPPRQHVYQLTGILLFENEVCEYLYMSPEARAAVEAAVVNSSTSKSLLSELLASKLLLAKPKGNSNLLSLSTSKGNSRSSRKKKKDSPPNGGAGNPPSEDPPKERTPVQAARDALNEAVEAMFGAEGMSYALQSKWANFLTGETSELTTPKKRSEKPTSNGEWFEHQILPGMDIDEITAFGTWYRSTSPGIRLPQACHKVNMAIAIFRGDPTHDHHVERARLNREAREDLAARGGEQDDPEPEEDAPPMSEEQREEVRARLNALRIKMGGGK